MELEENKTYPGRMESVKLVAGVLLLMIVASIIFGIIFDIFGIEYNLENPLVYFVMTSVISVFSLGGVIWYVMKNKGLNWDYIKGNSVKSILFYYKIIMLVIGLAIVVSEIDNLIQRIIPMSETYMDIFEGVLNNNLFLVFLALCIVAPLFEELLFRGIILRGLLKKLEHWSAIFFSAFLFAILHMNIWQGIGAFFIGIFIGWLFFKTGSLYVAIFAHFINNLFVILAVQYTSIPGFSDISKTGFQPLWFTLLGLILLVSAVFLIERHGEMN